LRKEGYGATAASNLLLRVGPSEKQEILFKRGINFNDVDPQLKRGSAVFYELVDKQGYNPKTQEHVMVKRQQLVVRKELPMGDDYGDFVEQKIR
jgi:tRNA(His) 5'-end guanylyltransferase